MSEVSEKSPINIKPTVTKAVAKRAGGSIIFHQGYGVWSTKDVFRAGNAVIRLVSSGASPSSRDFTAKELVDGTYASWVSGTPSVNTLYDQKGSFNLTQGFSANAPLYQASTNSVKFDKSGFFGNYRSIFSSSSIDGIGAAFGGNEPGDEVTLAMNIKDTTGSTGTGTQAVFGVYDNAPTQDINQRQKAIVQNDSTHIIGMRQRDNSYSLFDFNTDDALSSSSPPDFENVIGNLFRASTPGTTVTACDIFIDNTQEFDSSTNTLNTECQVRKFSIGGSRFETQVCIAFNKLLTDAERTELNTAMDNL